MSSPKSLGFRRFSLTDFDWIPDAGGSVLLHLLELVLQERNEGEEVADDAVIRDLEDRSLGIGVDRDDALGGAHSGEMLDRARDAAGDVERRRDDLAGLADLVAMRARS